MHLMLIDAVRSMEISLIIGWLYKNYRFVKEIPIFRNNKLFVTYCRCSDKYDVKLVSNSSVNR